MLTLAADMGEVLPVIAIAGGLTLAFVGMIGSIIKSTLTQRSREQSRREIAAYVAEGSISAEEGAKLMDAGMPIWERGKR